MESDIPWGVYITGDDQLAARSTGGVSMQELAARWFSGQTGQVPGLGWSILDGPPTGTPGNVTKMM
jgi:hypothetical protein